MLEMRFEPPQQLSLWSDLPDWRPECSPDVRSSVAAAPAPRPSPDPAADPAKDDRSGSVPRVPDPARETDENDAAQPPHEHGDDPGIHPDGPKRYHDDYGSPRRMSHESAYESAQDVMMECQP